MGFREDIADAAQNFRGRQQRFENRDLPPLDVHFDHPDILIETFKIGHEVNLRDPETPSPHNIDLVRNQARRSRVQRGCRLELGRPVKKRRTAARPCGGVHQYDIPKVGKVLSKHTERPRIRLEGDDSSGSSGHASCVYPYVRPEVDVGMASGTPKRLLEPSGSEHQLAFVAPAHFARHITQDRVFSNLVHPYALATISIGSVCTM